MVLLAFLLISYHSLRGRSYPFSAKKGTCATIISVVPRKLTREATFRLDLNRSSDESRFSEGRLKRRAEGGRGDVVSLFLIFV